MRVLSLATTTVVFTAMLSMTPAHAETTPNSDGDIAGVVDRALKVVGDTPLTSFEDDGSAGVGGVTISSSDSESIARQSSDSAQVITVLDKGERSATFDFDMPQGFDLKQADNGGIGVVKETESSVEMLGYVEAPWAVDANGKRLPTEFEVAGDTLVQHVDTSKAAFPVVADPSFTKGDFKFSWSVFSPTVVTVDANKRGSRVLSTGGKGALCIALAFVPVYGTVLAAICATSAVIDTVVYEYGFCSRLKLNALTRNVSQSYYKGGFCK